MAKLTEGPSSSNAALPGMKLLSGPNGTSEAEKLVWAPTLAAVPSSNVSKLTAFLMTPIWFVFLLTVQTLL